MGFIEIGFNFWSKSFGKARQFKKNWIGCGNLKIVQRFCYKPGKKIVDENSPLCNLKLNATQLHLIRERSMPHLCPDDKGGLISESFFFQFGPILKKRDKITVPQIFTSG